MLTRRGYTLIGSALGLLVAGRLLGSVELWMLSLASLTLLGLDVIWLRTRSRRLEAGRQVSPVRLHVGTEGTVNLEVHNAAPRPTPLMLLQDQFDDGRQEARFVLGPLAPGETKSAAYRIPTSRRGRFTVGPFAGEILDPFGFARRRFTLVPSQVVVVYPRIHTLRGVDARLGPDHRTGARTVHKSIGGDDFLALRNYVIGDDLRRVHWASTARVGELMVRQDEAPWQAPPILVLDRRAGVHTAASFELAVEAFASLVVMFHTSGVPFVATTSDGRVLRADAGPDPILDELVGVHPDSHNRLQLSPLRRVGATAAIVVTGRPDATSRDALGGVVPAGFGRTIVIATAPRLEDPGPLPRDMVLIDASRVPLPAAWEEGSRTWSRSGARV